MKSTGVTYAVRLTGEDIVPRGFETLMEAEDAAIALSKNARDQTEVVKVTVVAVYAGRNLSLP